VNVWRSVPEWIERRRSLRAAWVSCDDGRAARGTCVAGGTLPARERCGGGHDLRESGAVQRREGLERYPRTLEEDLRLLEEMGRMKSSFPATGICIEWLLLSNRERCERAVDGRRAAAGPFAGRDDVVTKLLNLVRADRAYFGEKDFQQLRVVTEMVRIFCADRDRGCPTVREASG